MYIDVAGLQLAAITPRVGYLWYLQRLVESGFAGRIMFGSHFADQVESGIPTIVDAPFLSAEQKAAILCSNAARFLAPFGIRLRALNRATCSARSYGGSPRQETNGGQHVDA